MYRYIELRTLGTNVRVISGTLKGRRLHSPDGAQVRPTSDRLRETLFNILGHRVDGARVLDACAGTGALGIEALSRGAAHVVFVEAHSDVAALIMSNLAHCEVEAQAVVVKDNLSVVEAEIYQVKNQSNQDPLNYPIRINNKLAALLGLVEGSESRPTDQSHVVFRRLVDLLDEQVKAMGIIILRDVGRLNELLIREGLEPIRETRLVS